MTNASSPGGFNDGQEVLIQALATYNAQLSISAPNPNTIINTCTCPVPPQTIPIKLPNLYITMSNYLGTVVNSFTFTTNANFKSRIAILTIQIFPPSTTVTSTEVTAPNSENSYAIVYTLQSPDGVYFQKEIQYPTTLSLTTFMPITNKIPIIPITLKTYQVATPNVLLNTTQITASFAGLPYTTQEQLLNSISPITQKFLITTNNLGLNPTVTSISGSYDPNSNVTTPTLISSLIPSTITTVPPIDTTDNIAIAPITVTLYSGITPYELTFNMQDIVFNQTDLLNGLNLNLFIYPPLYQNGPSSNYFIFIATLQTIDGLKFKKIVNQTIPLTYYPITFSITTTSLEGEKTNLVSNIANPLLTPQIYNMISPIRLQFRLQQNDNNVVVVSIT
ncbi:hypothetical protein KBB68_02035 [Candidatus Babeliales bacterium]|nr:hypothetical protein [Candidatus Babeliales bacterium]